MFCADCDVTNVDLWIMRGSFYVQIEGKSFLIWGCKGCRTLGLRGGEVRWMA